MEAKDFYNSYFGFPPFDFQIEVWESIKNFSFQNLPLLIKAPTGSGKTEAVVAPFLSQFINNEFSIAPRLIYVLPMRVLVNNIENRISNIANKISKNILVKTQHGDLPNSPFFMADIVVTTLDQFTYAFARASEQVTRHIDIPAGAIASSVVVFDEAHMYRDEFTFSIMRAIMEILYQTHIPFVVMTATMPESLERSLFESISNYRRILGKDVVQSELSITTFDSPLYSNGEANLSNEILEKIKNKKTLIVLNQVKRAQKVYEEIQRSIDLSSEQIVLLHSRYTRKDRKEKEKKALSLLPHKENGKIIVPEDVSIVISTQVLEAGIDFSAELLLTELAPADCLVQRAGRCARYQGEQGEMIVFPVEEEKGNLPYEKDHLDKTMEWLRKNENFNIKNFSEVNSFVNQTLDYKANDYEARDTLIDLYECVLYADSKPQNIQIRDSKPVTLVVIDLPIEKGKKMKELISDSINKTDIKENSIDVDIGVAWMLLKIGSIKYRLKYDTNAKKWNYTELNLNNPEIHPFNKYIIEKINYDENIGVKNDFSYFA